MYMNDNLKIKYTDYHEPDKWKNVANKRNSHQYGSGKEGPRGKSKSKKEDKPLGFSGRTAGILIRHYTTIREKKKK